jgi:hypothetical protein
MSFDPAYGSGPNPVAQFQADVQNFNNSPNSLQNILGQIEGSQGPQMGIYNLQSALAGNQYNLNTKQYQLSTGNLEQQAANQLAQLGISGQQIGLQGQGLQAEAGLLGTTTGLEQQEYAQQQTQYPEQLNEAALNYGYNKQNLAGNLASQGATNTVGSRQQQHLLDTNYYYQVADITRAKNLSQLQQQGTTAQQQYSAAEIARQQQNLALVAQSNGLSIQEVQQQLGYGLAQAGLDYQQNLPQLLNSLAGIYSGEFNLAQQAGASAGLLGNTSLAQVGNTSGLNLYSPGVTNVGR